MKAFELTNVRSAVVLGVYQAENELDAMSVMLQVAGYDGKDLDEQLRVCACDGEIVAKPVTVGHRHELSLYLVKEGEVTNANRDTPWDGTDSVLVAACSREGALRAARAFDRGEVGYDNLQWGDRRIAAVTLKDAQTGWYF